MSKSTTIKSIALSGTETIDVYTDCVKASGAIDLFGTLNDMQNDFMNSISEILNEANVTVEKSKVIKAEIREWIPHMDFWETDYLDDGLWYEMTISPIEDNGTAVELVLRPMKNWYVNEDNDECCELESEYFDFNCYTDRGETWVE